MDPIADLLTTIKNSVAARKKRAVISYSKIKEQILKIFVQRKVIFSYEIKKEEKSPIIVIHFDDSRKIYHLERVSKPGRRVYLKCREIRMPAGLGFVVVSTPKGVVDGCEAKKVGLGGEVICNVW